MTKQVTKKKESSELTTWQEEMSKYTDDIKEYDAPSGSMFKYLSIKKCEFSLQNEKLVDSKRIFAVILDSVFERAYYKGRYVEGESTIPDCFSVGKDKDLLVPSDNATEKQSVTCTKCKYNIWGSGGGKSKACNTKKRVALMIVALQKDGKLNMLESDVIEATEPVFLRVPATSINGYQKYVYNMATIKGLPSFGVISEITLIDDPKRNIGVDFNYVSNIPKEWQNIILGKVKASVEGLQQEYSKLEPDQLPHDGNVDDKDVQF